MNDALWTGLLDDFKALRDMQKGDELRGVLIEFSTPEALGRGGKIIHNKHYPEEWAKTRSIISEPIIDKREESKRVYRLMVVPYRGNEQLQGDNQTPDLNQEYQIIKSRLEELLSLAGKELLSLDSVSNRLPLEVTSLSNPVLSWLIFLFYLGKPDRYTWERVNQCIAFGVAMGAISRDDIKEMAPNFGPPNTDLPLDVGQFSFEPLAENSYSVIKNITAASIEAIYRIKGGLFSTDQEETGETEQVQQTESFTFDQLAVKYAGYSNRNGFIKQSKPFGVTCDKDGPWTIPQAIELFEKILEKGSPSRHVKGKMKESVSNWRQKL